MLTEEYSLYKMENIKRAKNDSDYLGGLMQANSNLIWFSIRKYARPSDRLMESCGVNRDDLEQIGNIGFMKAIRAFDTERGIKFSSFAAIAIGREVKHYLRSNFGVIKISRGAQASLLAVKNLEDELGYVPGPKELALLMGITEKKALEILKISAWTKSTEEEMPFGINTSECSDGGGSVEEKTLNMEYMDKLMETVKDKLSSLELEVLRLQALGNKQVDTAKDLGLTNMQVGRVLRKVAYLLSHNTYFEGKFFIAKDFEEDDE